MSAIYVEGSKNSKIGDVDSTYVSIDATCPDSCSLKESGCYAQTSFVGMINNKLNKQAKFQSPLQVARQEANVIKSSYKNKLIPNRDLRLHVSGDSRTIKGTRIINSAVADWKSRGGRDCWSYTHAFNKVPRKEWNNVSILASVDSIDQVKQARKQGYAPAIVVSEHISYRAYTLKGSDTKWIPCPAQTKNITCVKCRLCFNADRLFQNNFGIAFAAHGIKQEEIKRRLKVIQ